MFVNISSEAIGYLAQGTFMVAAGSAVLLNLDAVSAFGQRTEARIGSWLMKHLGESFLTRDIRAARALSGPRNSRIGPFALGVVLVLGGLALQIVSIGLLLSLRRSSGP